MSLPWRTCHACTHIFYLYFAFNFLWNCTVYLRTRRRADSRSLSLRCCISVVGGFKQNLSDHLFTALESQLQVMRRQMVRGPLQAALTLIYCNWTGWFRWWTASARDCIDRIGSLYSRTCGNTEGILSNGNKTPDHGGLTRRNTWYHLKTVLSSHFTAPSTDTLGLHGWLLRAGSRSLEERNEANCSETMRKWSGRWTECGGRR